LQYKLNKISQFAAQPGENPKIFGVKCRFEIEMLHAVGVPEA